MIYKFKKNFQKVWFFYPSKTIDVIIVSTGANEDGNYNILLNEKPLEVGSIMLENNNLEIYNLNYIDKFISTSSCSIEKNTLSTRLIYLNDKYGIETNFDIEKNISKYSIINIKSFEKIYVINELIISPISTVDKLYYRSGTNNSRGLNCNIITCFYFTKIDYLWHFNLDSLYESHTSQLAMYNLEELSYITEPLLQINNLIGVLNNLLWVDVDVQMRGSFLLAIDTETGAVVHLLQTTELQTAMPEHLYYYKKLRRTAKSHLDIENNMILGFGADFDHWQVDLTQPEPIIKFWYLEENFKNIPEAHAVQIDFSGITPTHIFFPNSHGQFPQVIAFNRKTMQVDWRQVFNDKKGYFSPKQVKANDTHLFVHMSDNSLHIFEKTED